MNLILLKEESEKGKRDRRYIYSGSKIKVFAVKKREDKVYTQK